MNDDSRTTFLMITALVFALAAMFAASPAGARPIDIDGTLLGGHPAPTSVRPDDQGGPLGVGAVTSSTPIWMKALQARSEALDRYYGLGSKADSETSNSGWYTGLEFADVPTVQQPSDDGFAWGKATFGIGAVLLAALLAATTVVATRSRHGRIATH